MTDLIQSPELISVHTPAHQIVVPEQDEQVAVLVVKTATVETEKIEHVVIREDRGGLGIIAVGAQGPTGPAGSSGGSLVETYTAGMNINGHRVIVADVNGLAVHADPTNPAHANAATKISLGAALSGLSVQVQLVGRITEPSWAWTPGGTIYVGALGVLTQTVPTAPAAYSKPVAVAETAIRILIVQEPPTMLN